MAKTMTLTPALLRKIVLEEKRKLVREAKKHEADEPLAAAEEVGADEYADTLEAPEVHTPKNEGARRRYQALSIQEHRLMAQLQQIRESKRNIRARLLRR